MILTRKPVNLFHSLSRIYPADVICLYIWTTIQIPTCFPAALKYRFIFTVKPSSSVPHNVAPCFWFWGIWITCCAGSDSCRSPLVIIQVSWSKTAALYGRLNQSSPWLTFKWHIDRGLFKQQKKTEVTSVHVAAEKECFSPQIADEEMR